MYEVSVRKPGDKGFCGSSVIEINLRFFVNVRLIRCLSVRTERRNRAINTPAWGGLGFKSRS
jgi:hypothetical protein